MAKFRAIHDYTNGPLVYLIQKSSKEMVNDTTRTVWTTIGRTPTLDNVQEILKNHDKIIKLKKD